MSNLTIDDIFLVSRELYKIHGKLSRLRGQVMLQQAETPHDTLLNLETAIERAMLELHLAFSLKL